jgi:hypothetical protein
MRPHLIDMAQALTAPIFLFVRMTIRVGFLARTTGKAAKRRSNVASANIP